MYPCSPWLITCSTSGSGRVSRTISWKGTPRNVMSKRDQRVTQWMSGCGSRPTAAALKLVPGELERLLDRAGGAERPGCEVRPARDPIRPAAPASWPSRTGRAGAARGRRPIDLALRSAVERNNPMPSVARTALALRCGRECRRHPSASSSPPLARAPPSVRATSSRRPRLRAATPRVCCRTSSRATSTPWRSARASTGSRSRPRASRSPMRGSCARARTRSSAPARRRRRTSSARCCGATGSPPGPRSRWSPPR